MNFFTMNFSMNFFTKLQALAELLVIILLLGDLGVPKQLRGGNVPKPLCVGNVPKPLCMWETFPSYRVWKTFPSNCAGETFPSHCVLLLCSSAS